MFLLGIYICIFIFFVIYCIFSRIVKVKIGKPPIDILFVAYKYSRYKFSSFEFLNNSTFSRKTHKLIKFCYFGPKEKQTEFAQGIILSENGDMPDNNYLFEAQKAGLNFFTTPLISHAIYFEFPIFLWYPITKLFAVIIGYPGIRRISELNNLCAYPVIEIHSMKSITIIVPLVRQDGFIVHEAEKIVFGKSYTELLELYRRTSSKSFQMGRSHNFEDHLISSNCLKLSKTTKRIMKG